MAEGTTGRLSLDTVFGLLAKQPRRYLLYCLFTYANPVSLPTVADQVTEWETGRPGDAAPDARLRIYMALYHDHLPHLTEQNVVTYYQEDDMVALDDAAQQFEPYVEQAYVDEVADGRDQVPRDPGDSA